MNSPNSDSWSSNYLHISDTRLVRALHTYFYRNPFCRHVQDRRAAILDVGCGNGAFLRFLHAEGYQNCHGIEPDTSLFDEAPPAGSGLNITPGSSLDIPFPDGRFDAISFHNVLHHLNGLDEYETTCEEADRCLKKGGKVVIVEPCNEPLYAAKRALAKALAPWSRTFATIRQMMMEELEPVTFFFHNRNHFKQSLQRRGYTILRDRKVIHQWTFVAQK